MEYKCRSLKVISRELKVYYNSICLFINDDVIMHSCFFCLSVYEGMWCLEVCVFIISNRLWDTTEPTHQ